jgi:hypothetical protein
MVSIKPRRPGRQTKPKSGLQKSSIAFDNTLEKFLGPSPLLEGEDPANYAGLLEQVRQQTAPKDVIEHIYVRDIVDLTWELMRARKIKVALLYKGQVRVVQQFVSNGNWPGLDMDTRDAVNSAIKKRFSDAVSILKKKGITLEDIMAQAFASESKTLQVIEQNMMQIEARRNFALREIERRRTTFAKRLENSVNVVEAEYKEVKDEKSQIEIEKG